MTPRETIADLVAAGMTQSEAVRIAREEFTRQQETTRKAPKPDPRHAWQRGLR